MEKHIKEIFADYEYMLKKFRKNDYIANMELFEKKWKDILCETIDKGDYEQTSNESVDQVISIYSRFGRLSKTKKMDLGLYMIYFIFPSILRTGKENASKLCDTLLATWNDKMDTDIEYITYDEIVDGFNTKMFGIF